MKTLAYILVFATGSALGFFAARYLSRDDTVSVEYIRGSPVSASVEIPEPVRLEVPALLSLPLRLDTVYIDSIIYVTEKIDTAAIIADYELKRSYAIPLFDNEAGRLNISLSTQYNRLGSLSYEFTPISKIVYVERTWQPFAMLQYSAAGGIGAGGGAFYRRMGYYIMYSTDLRQGGFGAGVMVRF